MDREAKVSRLNAKVAKAEEFLVMASLARDAGAFDAAASLAVSAAINASDAIIFAAGKPVPQGKDHGGAVSLLRSVAGSNVSRHLIRALGLKNRAQYGFDRCRPADADDAIKAAERLMNRAKGIA